MCVCVCVFFFQCVNDVKLCIVLIAYIVMNFNLAFQSIDVDISFRLSFDRFFIYEIIAQTMIRCKDDKPDATRRGRARIIIAV